jgi:hypothetical protein
MHTTMSLSFLVKAGNINASNFFINQPLGQQRKFRCLSRNKSIAVEVVDSSKCCHFRYVNSLCGSPTVLSEARIRLSRE